MEHFYDDLLNIGTARRQQDDNQSQHYHRYEPTPYTALEKLFALYELKENDRIVDFGCGKGRLAFYVNNHFRSLATGIEMDESFFKAALKNQAAYLEKYKGREKEIRFLCCLAQDYEIHPVDNRFYFFNPFTVQIFIKVINNILRSAEQTEREIELLLYYPSEDYIFYLEDSTSFRLKQEVLLPGYSASRPNERFLVYKLEYI